jgi:hypothetical protein
LSDGDEGVAGVTVEADAANGSHSKNPCKSAYFAATNLYSADAQDDDDGAAST